jgi:hypothetical protein
MVLFLINHFSNLVNLGRQTWGHHHLCCCGWIVETLSLSLSFSPSLSLKSLRERGGGERDGTVSLELKL